MPNVSKTSNSESFTAIATAMARATHQLIDPEPKILEDPIADQILGVEWIDYINQTKEKRMTDPIDLYIRSHVVLRSRFTEDRLREAVDRGVTQYIILGAGLDTFAYRQPDWARPLTIFEVDLPDTQAVKRERLRNASIAIRDNITFVPYDYGDGQFERCLLKHGVSLEKPTLFSWLGVSMYLEENEIDETLKMMAAYPAGSETVLTYLHPKDLKLFVDTGLSAAAAEGGEPFKSTFTSQNLAQKLKSFGYSTVFLISSQQVRDWYYLNGRYFLPVPAGSESGEMRIAAAVV